jgi:hypothetical protein
MPIIRGKHSFDGHFTQLPNSWVRDSRLSYKARGLLAELMSHAVGFEVSRERLARNGQDGDRAIRTAIQELEDAGYLERTQTRHEDGRMGPALWITKDPFDAPSVRFAPADNPPAGNAGVKNTIEKKTEEKKDLAQVKLERLFSEFWSVYPRKVGKGAAWKAFAKAASDAEPELIVEGAVRLATDPNLPPVQFVPHAATWLNREGWLDDPYPVRVLSPEERKLKDEAEKLQRIERDRAEQARRRAEIQAEEERLRRDRELNPVERCEHERVKIMCLKCSPVSRPANPAPAQ